MTANEFEYDGWVWYVTTVVGNVRKVSLQAERAWRAAAPPARACHQCGHAIVTWWTSPLMPKGCCNMVGCDCGCNKPAEPPCVVPPIPAGLWQIHYEWTGEYRPTQKGELWVLYTGTIFSHEDYNPHHIIRRKPAAPPVTEPAFTTGITMSIAARLTALGGRVDAIEALREGLKFSDRTPAAVASRLESLEAALKEVGETLDMPWTDPKNPLWKTVSICSIREVLDKAGEILRKAGRELRPC